MEKLFYPDSIVIYGLSSKPNNIPRITLENMLRWGYRGRKHMTSIPSSTVW